MPVQVKLKQKYRPGGPATARDRRNWHLKNPVENGKAAHVETTEADEELSSSGPDLARLHKPTRCHKGMGGKQCKKTLRHGELCTRCDYRKWFLADEAKQREW